MSKFNTVKLQPYGFIGDTNPIQVEKEWTGVNNMRFNNFSAEKFGGTVFATTTTGQPYHLQFNGNHENPLWVYMGDGEIRTTDFSTDTDIDTNNLVSTGATNWDSTLFNNFPIMNNGVDAPFSWDNSFGNPVQVIPGFPASTICQSIKSFRGFLVAMNITDAGGKEGNRVLWSDLADGGALPPSWNIADPSTLGGDAYLTQDRAEIIDGLALRDFFVIYKTHSMIIMRLIGGQQVMSFQKSQINSGLLSKNCVQEFLGKHFIVSDADIVLFDGQSIESIADKRVRAEIFTNIDTENYRNSYVTRYDRQDEMWFCYPTTGQEFPTRAAIWNWKDNTWTHRDLENARHVASGLANFAVSQTYDEATYTYNDPQAAVPYLPIASNPTTDTLISADTLKLGIVDEGTDNYGVILNTTLEKLTMDLGDQDKIKIINSVRPEITGTTGTVVNVQIGTQMNPYDDIIWAPSKQITITPSTEDISSRLAHFSVKGRFISVRFTMNGLTDNYQLHGFDISFAYGGKY